MTILSIDIETYSSYDLTKTGVHRYVEAPDFDVLMVAVQSEDGAAFTLDLDDEEELDELKAALTDPTITKVAWNAAFERTCLAKWLGIELPPEQWRCTMAQAAYNSYPLSLDACAKALGGEQKDKAGSALIRYFSLPCKPTKANGMRTRNLPEHDPEKWEAFKRYCAQDVATERDIATKMVPLPDDEQALWCLDQRINDRGILVDRELVRQAIDLSNANTCRLMEEATRLTGLDNPNSAAQIKAYLEAEGMEVATLRKSDLPELLKNAPTDTVTRLLQIRSELAKTSVKKYEAMAACVCDDGRVRGLLQYYGANRTGRWAGRLIQVQNLPKNTMDGLDIARSAVLDGDADTMGMLFNEPLPVILSQLIRTAFIAPDGHTFIVADFSAIEARVLAWLAGEQWRLDVFATHGKIYEASAAQMFKVPLESIGKGSPLRQKGKVAELALGYQGGANALIAMGALDMGISEEELPAIVSAWRRANRRIVDLWTDVEDAARYEIEGLTHPPVSDLRFLYKGGTLIITLPSGRQLFYPNARITPGKFGDQITYDGMDQTTKQWGRQSTYGGKLVENITQAVARDLLAHAMCRLTDRGVDIVAHIHDEVISEWEDTGWPVNDALEAVCDIMATGPAWAKGLPLRADGYITKYYKKD